MDIWAVGPLGCDFDGLTHEEGRILGAYLHSVSTADDDLLQHKGLVNFVVIQEFSVYLLSFSLQATEATG